MRARVIFCLFAFAALAFPGLAEARRGAPSLDRVLPQIRRATPGTFYDAQGPFVGPNGQPAYRIKWMTPEGRIIWFYVDARTGQALGAGGQFPGPNPYAQPNYPRFRDGGGWGDESGRWNRGGGWNGRSDGRGGDHGGDRGGDRGGGRGRHGG